MAKAQGKKAAAAGKKAVKKVAARVKSAVSAAKKKVTKAAKKPAAPVKPKAKPAPKPSAKKPAPKKAAENVKQAAKAVKKTVVKAAKSVKPKPALKGTPVKAAPAKAAAKPPAKAPAKATPPPKLTVTPTAVPPPVKPAAPVAPPPKPPADEKKRGRRARPRVHSDGAPAAAWLSTEKPRPASFIPAPPRAEAPSAIAAPPASSDRLIRPEDVAHPAVRTVPVRIDVEQGAGRFYVIASPMEVTVRAAEGIEWDFRYIGGADVSVDEVIIEFERPSPFTLAVFKSRRPGGARPHRQLSGGAVPGAVGKRIQYTVRAMNQFKTELARTTAWLNVTA
jgi:hypothetical protein